MLRGCFTWHTGSHSNKDMGNNQVQPPEEAFCQLNRDPLAVAQLYLIPSFFLVVLILGLPLNLLSLWIFFHRMRRWSRSTVLLFNLTLADTSWLLALPVLIQYHLGRLYWTLGLPMCAAVRMLYHNYFYLSIYFVTLISADRYLAIVHPLRSLVLLGRRPTCLLCVAAWLVTLLLSVPVATMTRVQTCPGSNRTVCTLYTLLNDTGLSLPYTLVCSVTGFLLPLLFICYCGLRSVRELRQRPCCSSDPHNKRRRLRRVLSAVLVLFALFYLPYHMSRNAAIVVRRVYPDTPASWRPADLAFALEMCLCSLSTCVNPLFSSFIGPQFRREFHGSFASLFPRCPPVLSNRNRRVVRPPPGPSTVTPMCTQPGP
ncbi:succinate receptor 1-like [Genypterus blacodes]|uniref:succinate receptor 1-like n=1 Tax=Genypterus blacodes TaxID=154954 RepID=UPI003F76523F